MAGGEKSLISRRSKTLNFRAYFAWKDFERDKTEKMFFL